MATLTNARRCIRGAIERFALRLMRPYLAACAGTSLVLVGPAATGKSSAGRLAASILGWSFLDIDDAIESIRRRDPTASSTTPTGAESPAVADEVRHLFAHLPRSGAIIATGARSPCDFHRFVLLCRAGLLVWVDTPEAELCRRMAHQRQAGERVRFMRPFEEGRDVAMEIRRRLVWTLPWYRLAHRQVCGGGGKTVADVAAELATIGGGVSGLGRCTKTNHACH